MTESGEVQITSSERPIPVTPKSRLKPLVERFFRGKESLLPEERESRAELAQYRPDSSKFPEPRIAESFFHPVDHLARTLVWSDVIANMLPPEQRDTIDKRVLRVAAVLHDSGRGKGVLADKDPHQHGAIAAELLRDRAKLSELLPNAHIEDLTDAQIEDAAYLVENHHHFNHAKAQIRPDMENALTVLQTADGLDLARGNFALGGPISIITDRTSVIDNVLPIVKHTLRIPRVKKLRTMASKFATQTQWEIKHPPKEEFLTPKDRFTVCLDIAQDMGLVKP